VAGDEGKKNNRKMIKADGQEKRKLERKREMKMRRKKGRREGKITVKIWRQEKQSRRREG
jgi:hypothetical protein